TAEALRKPTSLRSRPSVPRWPISVGATEGLTSCHLRKRRNKLFLCLPKTDQFPSTLKCASEGRLLAKCTIEVCVAKVCPLAFVLAPEGTPVGACRRNDERVRVGERWNEASRMARRDNNDTPSYPCAI